MTCQWCTNYRRREGHVMCLSDDGEIRHVGPDVRADNCTRFNPRRICTTCGHGCSQDDKASKPFGGCPMWELRVLSTWGGNRRWPRHDADKSQDAIQNDKENKE